MRKKYRKRPSLDKLVQEGCSLREMERSYIELSHQGILNYIHNTQQYNEWIAKRRTILGGYKKSRKMFLDWLATLAFAKARNEGFAVRKAVEYYLSVSKKDQIELERLIKLFQEYEEARDLPKRERPSYKKLSETSGVCPESIADIFRRVELKPFHRQKY